MFKIKYFLVLIIATLFACKKKEIEIQPIENPLTNFIGTWSPYESTDFGTQITSQGPFTHNSFFGVYDESVKIHPDGKYSPGIWENDKFKEDPSLEDNGTVILENKQLIFQSNQSGIFFKNPLKTTIEKHTTDELWLKTAFRSFKLRKVQ